MRWRPIAPSSVARSQPLARQMQLPARHLPILAAFLTLMLLMAQLAAHSQPVPEIITVPRDPRDQQITAPGNEPPRRTPQR